jgi:hypothetical protein
MKSKGRKSTRLKVVAIAEDGATGEFIAVIEFRDIDGKIRQIQQPRSMLRKIDHLREVLENAGAYLPASERKCRAAIGGLSSAIDGAKRWKYAARLGWCSNHRAFVLPDHVIGQHRTNVRILPPRRQKFEVARKGSHKAWVRSVAEPARFSSSMILGICMALAAPLLGFMDLHSFGILLSGPSKGGKSTALVVAASVMGIGREEDLPNFRTTDLALGEIPTAFNDTLMPINELGLLKGNAKTRQERLRDLSYGLAEGRGTTYSKFVSLDNGAGGERWRTVALARGENAMEDIAIVAGVVRATGESIRWADVCGVRRGTNDIFDRCPEAISGDDRTAWVRQKCRNLRHGAARNHGVAIDHYVKRVIKRRRKIARWLRPLIEEFIQAVGEKGDDPAVRHLAGCFGLIRAAGILGVRFRTVPYSEKLIDRSIRRCYRAAKRGLRTETDLLREGLRRLRVKLSSGAIVVTNGTDKPRSSFKGVDAYKDETASKPTVTIRAEKFKAWFDDPRQPALVLRSLQSKKALLTHPRQIGCSQPKKLAPNGASLSQAHRQTALNSQNLCDEVLGAKPIARAYGGPWMEQAADIAELLSG